MISDAILDVTKRNDIVLDAFGGSGSTLLAAEKIQRRARLIEIEPKYVDVTLERYLKMTENDPVLEKSGQTYSALKAEKEYSYG
jgi:DNA modification methylase